MERRRSRLAQLLRFAVAGSVATAWATSANAANWQYVTTSADNSMLYLDLDSIRVDGDGRGGTLWIKWDYSRNAREKSHYAMEKMRINCTAETLALIAVNKYDAKSDVIESRTYSRFEQKDDPIAPESTGDALMKAVCHS